MSSIKFRVCLTILITCLCCNKEPTPIDSMIELRSDFSESEFKKAIIGKWQSVYEHQGEENVIYLELNKQGKAKLTIERDGTAKNYEGNYMVDFLRPPSKGSDTWAELAIITPMATIKLSRVHFDLHNALPIDTGLLLRMDEPPYGVLKRT